MQRYDHEYLEDGVYIHHDGCQIWLTTMRENGEHQIALEPTAVDKLIQYRERIFARAKGDKDE